MTVDVTVGVLVIVHVGVWVGVSVGVKVGVLVGVSVGVSVGVAVYVMHASARQSVSGSNTQFRSGGQNCPPTNDTHAGPSHAQQPGVVTTVGVGVTVGVSVGVDVGVGEFKSHTPVKSPGGSQSTGAYPNDVELNEAATVAHITGPSKGGSPASKMLSTHVALKSLGRVTLQHPGPRVGVGVGVPSIQHLPKVSPTGSQFMSGAYPSGVALGVGEAAHVAHASGPRACPKFTWSRQNSVMPSAAINPQHSGCVGVGVGVTVGVGVAVTSFAQSLMQIGVAG